MHFREHFRFSDNNLPTRSINLFLNTRTDLSNRHVSGRELIFYAKAGGTQQERSFDGETKSKEEIWLLLWTNFGAIAGPHSCLYKGIWK